MRIAQTLSEGFVIIADSVYEMQILTKWANSVIKETKTNNSGFDKDLISSIEYCFVSKERNNSIIADLKRLIDKNLKDSIKIRNKYVNSTGEWKENQGFVQGLDWVLGLIERLEANQKNDGELKIEKNKREVLTQFEINSLFVLIKGAHELNTISSSNFMHFLSVSINKFGKKCYELGQSEKIELNHSLYSKHLATIDMMKEGIEKDRSDFLNEMFQFIDDMENLHDERCRKCFFGYDCTYDGSLYELNADEQGPRQYVQGCYLDYLPAEGYPCFQPMGIKDMFFPKEGLLERWKIETVFPSSRAIGLYHCIKCGKDITNIVHAKYRPIFTRYCFDCLRKQFYEKMDELSKEKELYVKKEKEGEKND